MTDWFSRWLSWPPAVLARNGTDLIKAGRDAVHEAERIWSLDVIDPKRGDDTHAGSRHVIDQMIRAKAGLGWSWLPPYGGDGMFEWCGAFAARAWGAAGLRFDARYTFWSSTWRLVAWAKYQPWEKIRNAQPASGPYRMIIECDEHSSGDIRFIDGTSPRAGDILIVGGVASGPGKHIAVIESFDPNIGAFRTIEGNAYGAGPAGNKRQGVVRAVRQLGLRSGQATTLYHARWVIRPAPSDLERPA